MTIDWQISLIVWSDEWMDTLKKVLQDYQINATEIIPVTSRLFKVQSYPGSFALKRSRLRVDIASQWRSVYQLANRHQLHSIVPIYLTKQGQVYQHHQQEVYYLSPWIEQRPIDEPEHETESAFQEIGKIHWKTKQQYELSVDEMKLAVTQEKERTSADRELLLKYVEAFEQRHFMSPFELQVCMQYRDIDNTFSQLNNWYDCYLEDIEQDKQWHTALCHGNLRSSHIICHNSESYFINWEKARIGNPVADLAAFFSYELQFHDSRLANYIHAFPLYEKANPLLQSERSLLAIYLLDPKPYLRLIDSYKRQPAPQPFQIRKLERAYRRLMQGLSLQSYLYEKRAEVREQQTDTD